MSEFYTNGQNWRAVIDNQDRTIINLKAQLSAVQRERDELAEWKREMIAVDSECNWQELGELLGLKLGSSIRRGIIPAVTQLKAELATLRDGWLQERQKFASIVSHLEAPHSFKAEEPGVYIHLVHVCTDGSGIVSMFKKVEEVKCAEGEEPLYPCKEWREFHANRTKHVMPHKWSDMAPPTDGRAE